jgi:hypothetical protein
MKTRSLVSILILVLALLIVVESCATGKKAYVVKEDEELYGTWANSDYNYAAYATPKFVFHPDGKSEGYPIDTEIHAHWYGEFIITNKWIDSEGIIWYTINLKRDYYKNWTYSLVKISNFGKTVEFADSPNDYPKEINPDDRYTRYSIYYRQ